MTDESVRETRGVAESAEHAAGRRGTLGVEGPFGVALRTARQRAGLSKMALDRRSGVDPAFVLRMEKLSPVQPSRAVVEALAHGLGLGPEERDDLLLRAGWAPRALLALEAWDPLFARLAALWAPDKLDPAERQQFRQAIEFLLSLIEERHASRPESPQKVQTPEDRRSARRLRAIAVAR